MPVRHFDELGDIYSEGIQPKTEKQTDHLLHEQKVGDIPKDALGHNTNPTDGGKAFEEAGPEAAENFEPSPNDTKKKKDKKSAYDEEKMSNPVEEGLFGRTTKGGAKGAVIGGAGGAAGGALAGHLAAPAIGAGLSKIGGDFAGTAVGKFAPGIGKMIKGAGTAFQKAGETGAGAALGAKYGAGLGAVTGGAAGATHGAMGHVLDDHDTDPDDEHSRRENRKKKLLKGGMKRESTSESQQNDEEGEKNDKDKINNFTMKEKTTKSTFDRLFEDVMSEDFDDFVGGGDIEGGDDLGGEDLGGEEDLGGDFVTLELPRELAEMLHLSLGEQLGGGEDEIEDLGDAEDFGDEGEEELEDSYQESHVELEKVPDTVTKLATQNGGNNQVDGSGHKPAGGSAATDASGEVDGGKPKKAPEGFNYSKTKSNKVGGKVSGGNKDMFKA